MRNIKVYLILFLLGVLLFILKGGSLFEDGIFTLKEIPFPPAAEIHDTKGALRVGVEKVVKESYYITYSHIEGDRSYFATFLLIENLQQADVDKKDFESISITDNLGNKYKPLPYYKILDFPEDQPLGWKVILFNKFPPLNKKASFINIDVKFNNHVFELDKVELP